MYSSKSSFAAFPVSIKATTALTCLRRKCHLFLSRNLFNLILIYLFHITINMLILLFVCLSFYVPSTICQVFGDGSYWVEPVLSKDLCVLLKDTTQWRWWSSNPWRLRLESSSLPLSHCAPWFLLLQREGQSLPNARECVHSIQSIKTCPRSRSYNIFKCSTQLSMEFILFINVKECWHLNSIFKIGEFLHVNKKTFTYKLTF